LVHLLAALDEVYRVEIEHTLGLFVVAHHGMVAGEADHVGEAMKAAESRSVCRPSRLRSRQVVWKMGSPPRRTISPETTRSPSA
jgi:hypothetical protein